MKAQRFFGRHICEGVAEYRPPGENPYRIMLFENALVNMDPTFSGCPVVVQHEDMDLSMMTLDQLKEIADGIVVRSFYNRADGKHWAEFMIFTEAGAEAVRKGWKLSNAYIPKNFRNGGTWNGVDYEKEVTTGDYEHLAIVPNPRYDSIILTPEQFKAYNSEKELELQKIANSKEEKGMLSIFKRQKVENAKDLEGLCVTLKNGKDISIEELAKMVFTNAYHCNGDEMVKMGEKSMSVNELVSEYSKMSSEFEEMKKKNEGGKEPSEEEKKKNEEAAKKAEEDKKKNEEAEAEKKKNEEKAKAEEEEKKKNNLEKLRNAQQNAKGTHQEVVELGSDQAARGKSRYGSGK